MKLVLRLARGIDAVSDRFAVFAEFSVLTACLISAGNAFVRYSLNYSSNALLEIQWYLFAACVMLGAAQVLRKNEHVRVDILYSSYPNRIKAWVDLMGLVLFLIPLAGLVAWLALPAFQQMYVSGETSGNAGGLVRWPAMLTVPLGMGLLLLQAISEIIKRVAWIRGVIDMDDHYERPTQ